MYENKNDNSCVYVLSYVVVKCRGENRIEQEPKVRRVDRTVKGFKIYTFVILVNEGGGWLMQNK